MSKFNKIEKDQLLNNCWASHEEDKLPAQGYIHRKTTLVNIKLRILPELKKQAENASAQLATSLNTQQFSSYNQKSTRLMLEYSTGQLTS